METRTQNATRSTPRRSRAWVFALVLAGAGCAPDSDPTAGDIALNDRGVALMGRYEYETAEQTFAEVVDNAPRWLDARVNWAIAILNRQQEKDERRALEILADVLEQDPDHARAAYTSGILHLYLGEAAPAERRLRQVVDADPDDAFAAYFLGQIELQSANHAEAASWFRRALELDPYLRSAYWAGAQALRRAGQIEESQALLDDYQRFEGNPAAHSAAFSYGRMGSKAQALATTHTTKPTSERPAGALFSSPAQIAAGAWTSISAADINGDGTLDLAASNADGNRFFFGAKDGSFAADADHPLAAARPGASLWADMDDDGDADMLVCGPGGAQLWMQLDDSTWEASEVGHDAPCGAGALFDADHDGDLDIFVTGPHGSELLNNNRDGSFRPLAKELGIVGAPGRQVLAADLDSDRDLDLVVLNEAPPHDVWQNDRTWRYRPFPGLEDFRGASLAAVAAADADADGRPEIYGAAADGALLAWRPSGAGWKREPLHPETTHPGVSELAVADFDGDGRLELLRVGSADVAVVDPASGNVVWESSADRLATALPVPIDAATGPALVVASAAGIDLWPPGTGRFPFLAMSLSGRSEADQMRSNASGLGTRVAVRTAGRWTVLDALDSHSGPGQSLVPLSVGLGGNSRADFVSLQWSDGVAQTELDLEAERLHEIAETQRQLASCPVLFAWNGESYAFVADVLGVGGLGFFNAPGRYAPPRPFESFLLDAAALAPRDGRYLLKFAEPMEETGYLDAARLRVFDLPADFSLVLDERMATADPPATGRPIAYRRSRAPKRATNAVGEDVLSLVAARDLQAPPPGAADPRFIGLLERDQVLTLEFGESIDAEGAVLVADGWIEYPYSQTVFAAWQADKRYRPASLEARGADGEWRMIAADFGYPAGMPRTMALPLPHLPAGTERACVSHRTWKSTGTESASSSKNRCPSPCRPPGDPSPPASRAPASPSAPPDPSACPTTTTGCARPIGTPNTSAASTPHSATRHRWSPTSTVRWRSSAAARRFTSSFAPACRQRRETTACSPSSSTAGQRTWTSTRRTANRFRPCRCWTAPTPTRWISETGCTPATTCAFRRGCERHESAAAATSGEFPFRSRHAAPCRGARLA